MHVQHLLVVHFHLEYTNILFNFYNCFTLTGITSGSASSVPLFVRPMDPPQELDFRDNSLNFEEDNKFAMADDGKPNAGYEYNAGLFDCLTILHSPS